MKTTIAWMMVCITIIVIVRSGTKPWPVHSDFCACPFRRPIAANFPSFSSRIFRSRERGRYDRRNGEKGTKATFHVSSQHRYIRARLGRSVYVLTASAADRLVSSRLVVAQTLMTSLSLIRIPIVAAAVFTGAPLHLAATVPLSYVPGTTTSG